MKLNGYTVTGYLDSIYQLVLIYVTEFKIHLMDHPFKLNFNCIGLNNSLQSAFHMNDCDLYLLVKSVYN